jgi:hypothetical protein
MRMSSGNLSILKSFQFHTVGKRKMVNDEQRSSDVLA